jgi:hypothetical protein
MKPAFRLGYTKPLTRYKFNPTAAGNAMLSTTQKKFGTTSLYLDGTGDSVQAYDSNIALGSGDFTIECWAYLPNVSSRTNGICDFRTSGTNLIAPAIYVNASAQIILNMNGTNRIIAGGVPANSWWHFAYSRAGNQNKFFINGTQAGSTWVDQSNYTYSQFIIGSLTGGNNNPALGFYDEFRISRTARYTANFTAPTEPFENDEFTLLLLHFNDYHGSTRIEDDIGNLAPQMTRASLLPDITGNSIISTNQYKFGSSSAYFDGTGDSIRYVSDTLAIGFSDFTIECWVYATAKNRDQNIFDQRTATTSQAVPVVYVNTSNQLTYYVSQAIRIQSTANSIDINTWYHIAVSRSGTSTKMFINGTQVGSTYTDTNNYSNIPLAIGAYNNGSTVLGSWQGYIDEFRVSNTARYTANFTPPTEPFTNDDNTVLLLHFEGTNGSREFFDDAGTRSKLPITQVADAQISTAQYKFGSSSLYLDGTGDYLQLAITQSLLLRMSSYCIEMWIYPQRNNINQYIYESVGTTNVGGNTIIMTNTGVLIFFTSGATRIQGTTQVSTNTWHHIAMTRNGNDHRLFLNGVQEAATWTNTGHSNNYLAGHKIGAAYNGTVQFQGYIDEVRVSRVPRYTANFTPPTTAFTNDANTLLLLHFEAGNGSTIFEDDNT